MNTFVSTYGFNTAHSIKECRLIHLELPGKARREARRENREQCDKGTVGQENALPKLKVEIRDVEPREKNKTKIRTLEQRMVDDSKLESAVIEYIQDLSQLLEALHNKEDLAPLLEKLRQKNKSNNSLPNDPKRGEKKKFLQE